MICITLLRIQFPIQKYIIFILVKNIQSPKMYNNNSINALSSRSQIQNQRQGNLIGTNSGSSSGIKSKGNTSDFNHFGDIEKKEQKNLITKDVKSIPLASKQSKDTPIDKPKKIDPLQNIDPFQKDLKSTLTDKKVLTEPSQQPKSNNQKLIGQSPQLASKFLSPHKNAFSQQTNVGTGHQRKLSQKIESFKSRINNEVNTLKTQSNPYISENSVNISSRKQQQNPFSKIQTTNIKVKQPRMSQPVKNSIENDQQFHRNQPRKTDYYLENPSIDNKFYKPIESDPSKVTKSKIYAGEFIEEISTENTFKKNKDPSNKYNNMKTINNNTRLESSLDKEELKVTDFIKGKLLGSGKFGSVNAVKHKKTGFVCAMKAIPKSMIRQQNIINQLIRQIKIQSCLDHPNIIKLYGFFCDKDYFYLLLELASEGHLYGLLKQKRNFKQNSVIYIMRQLCEALKYLHNSKVIHRDLKPQNIVFQYGIVKICDFGWSVSKGGNQLRSTFCGTPLYVSPQILKGHLYDEKIDIWSIGILAYELLVGDIPFQITTEDQLIKIIKEDIVFPPDINISIQAKDFVLKILKKNPNDRLKIDKLLQHPFLMRQIQQWSF